MDLIMEGNLIINRWHITINKIKACLTMLIHTIPIIMWVNTYPIKTAKLTYTNNSKWTRVWTSTKQVSILIEMTADSNHIPNNHCKALGTCTWIMHNQNHLHQFKVINNSPYKLVDQIWIIRTKFVSICKTKIC